MDKVVVIGGSGFVGSHAADELTRRGYAVTVFDSAPSRWLQAGQEFVLGDLLDREAVRRAVEGARYVYQFAGVADIGESADRPYDTINANVMGVASVLEAAVEAGIERLLYASTMYVYSPYGSFYRASKQAAEILIEAYHDKYDLEYTMLRYGSLYGPRAQPWNGLRRYVREIVAAGKLDYPGTGSERREYVHVSDAARLSVDVLDPAHANRAVVLSGTQVLTSTELVQMICEIAGVENKVRFVGEGALGDHYTLTTYRYSPKQAKKLVPSEFVDIGPGILDIVEEIHRELEES